MRVPILALAAAAPLAAQTLSPGPARVTAAPTRIHLTNAALTVDATVRDHHLSALHLTDKLHHRTLTLPSAFQLRLRSGEIYTAADLLLQEAPALHNEPATPNTPRLAEHFPGASVELRWQTPDHRIRGTWQIELRDDSNYVRESLTITAAQADIPLAEVRLVDATLPEAKVVGTVAGSPIVSQDVFLGLEDPLSESRVTAGRATATVYRDLPLKAAHPVTYSAVFGVARTGQMRRDFLAYLERERAHRYRTFLHYNSWYDLGYFTPFDEAGALDRIHTFGEELTRKRGVVLSSFLFDDGWDNHRSLWQFNTGFPNGFTRLKAEAANYNAAPGVWLSPWGGYSTPKQERIAYGREQGYEIVNDGYALSGPKYFERFRQACLDMVTKYGINQFKFDGTGNADSVFKGSAFDSDFAAAQSLIHDLRAAKPDLYINLTTGTYPSPFWLMTADSIWRGGEDDDLIGVGTNRQRWITYRDADTYQRIVQGGPLFPLNSLMLHGIIYAQYNRRLNTDPGNDFRSEVRSYFGTGTQLQEMYITPSLISTQNWDDLAEAARWSRDNAEVLKDTHWVGGNPAWLEPYGWAAWTPKKAILTLRNPSDKPQSFTVDPARVFELPEGAPSRYEAFLFGAENKNKPELHLTAGQAHTFQLAPFEVLVLNVIPEVHLGAHRHSK